MRYSFLFIFLFSAPAMIFSQRNANLGVFLGTSYYMGDINPNMHFYRPQPSFGLIYRYNIGKFYAIRANGYVAHLTGDEVDFPQQFHPDRHLHPANFNTSLLDATLQFEFNFLPFIANSKKWDYTPYVAGGVGYSIVLSSVATSGEAAIPHVTFPFGIGFKVNLTNRISTGLEWSFRKTFNDRVDGVENSIGIQSPIHNNDWYSFAGIFITYKFFNFAVDCPAYSN